MSSSSASKGKKFTLKTVLDGLRGSGGSSQNRLDTEIEETLRSDHYHVTKTVRHGFPFQPTSLAFDPVQHLLAIGNRTGSLRIIGQPGVDRHCSHDAEVSIIQILFLVNEGALVTVTNDDHLHLWNLRQKQPSIVHSLKFQREKVSKCHLPFQSKWLYVGTERGNVHVVNIESFTCSGYIINWNKAIELSRKTHPGPVVHLSDNPVDPNKLLIGFESGAIVFWDLKTKSAEYRYNSQEALRSISWHNEGKQFMCSHSDGSLSTWNVKSPQKAVSITSPHAKIGPDGKLEVCKPIAKVEWRSTRNGEPIVIFSGGMSYDRAGRTPSITVMAGKSTTVLEMEHNVVDFVSLCDTPWVNDFQDPFAIVVLLQNDLVVIDLTTPGYPCFENPYPMDLHESPVTACQYYANCPMDIIPALYSTGKNQKKTGFSEKPWPIRGGLWGASGTSYPEIIITGHADGSLKFWDASSVTLQFLYKLKTAKVFEKPKRPSEDKDDDPFAIQNIFLCLESRIMCVAGPTHCILFKFSKQETSVEVVALEFPIVYEVYDELDSPEFDFSKPSLTVMGQHSSSMGSYSSSASDNARQSETVTSVKVRGGSHRWGPGFLPELVCVLCWVDGEPPGNITVMSLNSSYGLLTFGNESGLAIVDYMQKTCLLNLGTPDLYGSMDPYQRAPRSPRSKKAQGEGLIQGSEDCKSPTVDQSGSNQTPGGARNGESSPSTPLTPSTAPECKISASSLGGVMASAPRAHLPVSKSVSLTPSQMKVSSDQPLQQKACHQGHNLVVKSLSLGAPNIPSSPSANIPTQMMSRIPSPTKMFHASSEKYLEPLGPFEEDYFKAEPKVEENSKSIPNVPRAPPRSKRRNKKAHALEPLYTKQNISTSQAEGPHKVSSASFGMEQKMRPSPLTPVILLPRSFSEMGYISSGIQDVSEDPALLCPSSPLKPKSVSTGDILAAQGQEADSSTPETRRREADGETFSDQEREEREHGEVLRKSSSDTQLPFSDKLPPAELHRQTSEMPSKNWLVKKIQNRSKKKKKGVTESAGAGEENMEDGEQTDQPEIRDTETCINCDTGEDISAMGTQILNETSGETRENDAEMGTGVLKNPGSNTNFFGRVSLKIKSFSSRKSANDIDDDRDTGPLSARRTQQKSQERHREFKIEVLDLTDDAAGKHSVQRVRLSKVIESRKAMDKADSSSFSRSRSSSMSSLDNVTKEAIQCLVFADSYTRKQDNETSPCLWVGTSLGSIIVIVLVLQPDQRLSQPVIVSPSVHNTSQADAVGMSGSLYRMKGSIICMSFLDFKGTLIPALSEQWRDNRDNKDLSEKSSSKVSSRQMSVSNYKPKISPTSSAEMNNDRQFAIICSEKQARAVSLPSQTCAFKVKVTETSFVVKADIVAMRESVCLMCYVANGHILAFSLPSLKPLFDADFLPLTDYRVARTFCFSNNGHAMFLCSPTEIQKITYSAEISENLNEMLGELFLPKDTPEAPKQGFLKTLFGGGVATLDREELFGEGSGKASKGLAKHIPGTGNIQHLQHQVNVSGNEFSRTRLLVTERGEKLGELEDRSAQMMNSAEQFASAAHSVMLKYKDKKWYQF